MKVGNDDADYPFMFKLLNYLKEILSRVKNL